MAKTKEIEYIFDLIINDLNLTLFNDDLTDLMKFRKTCYEANEKSKLLNMFHKETLLAYDTTLRLFANIIFEKIPNERNLELETIPKIEEFKTWFGSLEFDDFILICFTLYDQQMMQFKTDEDLQFIINVYVTNRELSYVQPNKKN